MPKKYGVVTRRTVDDVDMLGLDSTYMYENEENLKTVVRELEHDRRFTKQQKQMQTSRRHSHSTDDYSPISPVAATTATGGVVSNEFRLSANGTISGQNTIESDRDSGQKLNEGRGGALLKDSLVTDS